MENAEVPKSGKVMYLRHFGLVSVFRTVDKDNDVRHYAAFDPRKKRMKTALGYCQHWGIESYHRAIKQVCCAERFFVRWKTAIRNHLFCGLRAFVQLEVQRWRGEIKSWYSLKRRLADNAVTRFIQQRTGRHSA